MVGTMSNSTDDSRSKGSKPSGKRPAPPKTVLDKLIVSIRAVQTHRGASRQAILKYCKAELDYDNPTAIRKALKSGVSSGKLIQTGQSFRVAGDAPLEEPQEERLEMTDLKVGKDDGEAAANGDVVTVSYVGTLAESGHQFDAAKKFSFVLGAGEVIKGWDQGVIGMRPGGKRRLVVPPKLGYGAKGSAPDIPPHAALCFEITLKSVEST